MKNNSMLFMQPDYHCSFLYRDEMRKLGWKADIYVPIGYPEEFLYETDDVLRQKTIKSRYMYFNNFANWFLGITWFLNNFWRYKVHFYYGRPPIHSFLEKRLGLKLILGRSFSFELFISKLFRRKLIYIPPGCKDFNSKEYFESLGPVKMCDNCGYYNQCNETENKVHYDMIERYFDITLSHNLCKTSVHSKEIELKYKVIDLKKWSNELEIPEEHRLPETQNLRIMHSAWLKKSGRTWQGRNIKGSPFIYDAVERLRLEGYPVEYFYVENKRSSDMRYYQAQADIIVEQLIYGWWGSTGVETMALGKPVICYLRPEWKKYFMKIFPEYDTLPIIEANTDDIYLTLKKLVECEDERVIYGKKSRDFASDFFNPEKNVKAFLAAISKLF